MIPDGIRSPLDLRDQLRELADLAEAVAALDVAPDSTPMRAVPGSRVPPGMQEVMDDDETDRALAALDDWADFLAHLVVDKCDVPTAPTTPGRLRLAGEHVAALLDLDPLLTIATFGPCGELEEHLRTLRRLAHRGERIVRTGRRCDDPTCRGQYVSPLGRPDADRHDSSLTCDRCGHVVPYVVWSGWPRARVQWITAEHAARLLGGITIAAVWQRARRGRWRRQGTGRDVRYHVADVRGDTPDTGAA